MGPRCHRRSLRTIDFKLAVDQKFKKIDVVAKYKNKNYAFVKEVKFENTAETADG